MGNLKAYVGDWSGNAGDDSGAVTLAGGRVYLSRFENQDADNPKQGEAGQHISVSGSTITVTVHNHQDVVNGRFIIIYA